MGETSNVLERGRTLMRQQSQFAPQEAQELLAAGRDPLFDPEHNVTDGRIERFLNGSFSTQWRTAQPPPSDLLTPGERRAIEAASAQAAAEARVWKAAYDAWYELEVTYYGETAEVRGITPEMLGARARAHKAATEALEQARVKLERSVAAVLVLKVEAQQRRSREELEAHTTK